MIWKRNKRKSSTKPLTQKRAKKLCLAKWRNIIRNGWEIYDNKLFRKYPEIKSYLSHCAYCELYRNTDGYKDGKYFGFCFKCPISLLSNRPYFIDRQTGCVQHYPPFKIWFDMKSKQNAKKVLKLIKKS